MFFKNLKIYKLDGDKLTTGRFETRAELESEVWDRYLNTP